MKKIKQNLIESKELLQYKKILSEVHLELSKEDLSNITFVLNNPNKFKFPPQQYPKEYNYKLNSDNVVKTTLDFYDSIHLGSQMRNIYQKYKDQIFIYKYDYPPDGGYTCKNSQNLGNGKIGICRINNQNNYLTYFNAAHEFMHILINEYDKIDVQTSEVHTRFIENLFGEYLVNKGVLSPEENVSHQKANNNVYDEAELISATYYLKKLIYKNKGDLTSKEKKQFIKKFCHEDINKFNFLAQKLYKAVNSHECNGITNNLRFINAAVGQQQLYNLYKENPQNFLKVYSDLLLNGNEISKSKNISKILRSLNNNMNNYSENFNHKEGKIKLPIKQKFSFLLKNIFNKERHLLPSAPKEFSNSTPHAPKEFIKELRSLNNNEIKLSSYEYPKEENQERKNIEKSHYKEVT